MKHLSAIGCSIQETNDFTMGVGIANALEFGGNWKYKNVEYNPIKK